MMDTSEQTELIKKIQNDARQHCSPELFEHLIGTMEYALKLNEIHHLGLDEEKIKVAALLHDYAKEFSSYELFELVGKDGYVVDSMELQSPFLLHGRAASIIAKNDYGITDKDILKALIDHTTGSCDMSTLGIIIFIADKLEKNRNFSGVDNFREMVETDLLVGTLAVMENHKKFVTAKGQKLHPNTDKAIEFIKGKLAKKRWWQKLSIPSINGDDTPSDKRNTIKALLTMDGYIIACTVIAMIITFLGSLMIGIYYTYSSVDTGGLKRFGPLNFYSSLSLPASHFFDKKKELLFLVGGLDDVQGVERTDTLMLVKLDLVEKEVKMISIPRDTLVKLPTKRPHWDRINSALPTGGKSLLVQTIFDLTGFYPDYLVLINFEGFEKVVDIVGGVEIDVEKDMNYDDYAGNLHIHLKKGPQVLNGKDALGYVRFRRDSDGDFSRIKRQQTFFHAFKERLKSPATALKMDEILKVIIQNIDVDEVVPRANEIEIYENGMSFPQYLTLAKVLKDVSQSSISADTLKMRNDGMNYYGKAVQVLDYQAFDELMLEFASDN